MRTLQPSHDFVRTGFVRRAKTWFPNDRWRLDDAWKRDRAQGKNRFAYWRGENEMVPRSFDDVYDDFLQQVAQSGGKSLYSPELVPPHSGDSWEAFCPINAWYLGEHPLRKNVNRRVTALEKKVAEQQGEYEAERAERQRKKEEIAAKQWEAEEQRRAQQAADLAEISRRAAERQGRPYPPPPPPAPPAPPPPPRTIPEVREAQKARLEDARQRAAQQEAAAQAAARQEAAEKEARRRILYAQEQVAAQAAKAKALEEENRKRHEAADRHAQAAKAVREWEERRQTETFAARRQKAGELCAQRLTTEWMEQYKSKQDGKWLKSAFDDPGPLSLLSVYNGETLIFNWADTSWGFIVTLALETHLRLDGTTIWLRSPQMDKFMALSKLGLAELGG